MCHVMKLSIASRGCVAAHDCLSVPHIVVPHCVLHPLINKAKLVSNVNSKQCRQHYPYSIGGLRE